MDASNVYGSNAKTAADLRLFNGGKLLYQKIGNENYCPQDTSEYVKVGNKTEQPIAFLAGITENVLQTLWYFVIIF